MQSEDAPPSVKDLDEEVCLAHHCCITTVYHCPPQLEYDEEDEAVQDSTELNALLAELQHYRQLLTELKAKQQLLAQLQVLLKSACLSSHTHVTLVQSAPGLGSEAESVSRDEQAEDTQSQTRTESQVSDTLSLPFLIVAQSLHVLPSRLAKTLTWSS